MATPKPPVADAIDKLTEIEKASAGQPIHLWPTLTPEPTSWSGTKGYVWADAYGDVKEALRAVWDIAYARGLTIQAALPPLFSFPDDHPQAHKGLVITFPRRKTLDADIQAVVTALDKANYRYGAGKAVKGASAVTVPPFDAQKPANRVEATSLSIRFEHFLDMGRDVDKYEHAILYRPSLPFMRAEVEAAAKAMREHFGDEGVKS